MVERAPRIEVAMDARFPVVAAETPVVSAPKRTCAPMAALTLQPDILALYKLQ
ncbi:hypothetical protein QCA50_009691 [Cerrena zonata]|uniref:Uncharacterized protein n=1 Tax=Cerrena zonata TaxID=2478898 RepID=A0AAW0G483_9APHY